MTDKKGKLVIISGPSGVGKSTICGRVVKELDAFLSVSATTRFKGESEVDGQNYWFLSTEEFENRLEQDDFLEHAKVFENYYGTPKQPVDDALAAGRVVILEIDVQGALQVKKQRPEAMMVFILPPRKEVLKERINGRGRGEDAQTKKRRLETAASEIAAAWQHYDHLVVNDDLEQAVREVIAVIEGNLEEQI
ncbi:MAG: guanylate kinase [Planctomycetota bacterium]|jgi:guanylate kinase